MLFDLQEDPNEFNDLGESLDHSEVIDLLYRYLNQWSLRMSQRVTMSEADIKKETGKPVKQGILVAVHHESDLPPEITAKYTGPARQIHFEREEDRIRYGGK